MENEKKEYVAPKMEIVELAGASDLLWCGSSCVDPTADGDIETLSDGFID